MSLLLKIARKIAGKKSNSIHETEPEAGYDLWSKTYDLQPDNLMLALDKIMFKAMSSHVNFENKVIADIGCGTGRHWKEILDQKPLRLIGYDVSAGMLSILKQKFPNAETYQSDETNKLESLKNGQCDIIITTLALAHFQNPEIAFIEWNRVLKAGGVLIITDYHPATLALGGDRTFISGSKTISIKNYVHPIENLKDMFKINHFEILDFNEKLIDESVKHYYEKQSAIHVFERFKNIPIIYGMYLKKGFMILRNLYSVTGDNCVDIRYSEGIITDIYPSKINDNIQKENQVLNFENALVFPGLINSHDHLDFNLFPRLGHHHYHNYVEWGEDIHKIDKSIIANVLRIPQNLRIQWGIYKNLLNGITTVVNHGPYLDIANTLIHVYQDSHVLHSVQLEKAWPLKLNRPRISKMPFAIHIGEGTDEESYKEIQKLLRWNLLHRELIGIHGVAMDTEQAQGFKALVWCPDSNRFLLGQTADIKNLKNSTTIVFGTDSTVSASWDIWEQLGIARDYDMVSDQELFDMLTINPAEVWNLKNTGRLEKKHDADIVIARKKEIKTGMNAFFAVQPEDILLVIQKGNIRYFDGSLEQELQDAGQDLTSFSRIFMNGNLKFVEGDLPDLINRILEYYPGASFPVTIS